MPIAVPETSHGSHAAGAARGPENRSWRAPGNLQQFAGLVPYETSLSALFPLLKTSGAAVHLVGCGGAGMRALAEFGRDLGWRITGSDAGASDHTLSRLEACGVKVFRSHSADHVVEGIQTVVFSPAVPVENPERLVAAKRGIPEASYPQVLGAISRSGPTIAVSGTHGKSTTTGLIGTALSARGRVRGVLCGAEVRSRGRHGWAGAGEWNVLEACEYRRHFLELEPAVSVVLCVEPDHFDCFGQMPEAIAAYRAFVERTSPGGTALIGVDTPAGDEVRQSVRWSGRVETMTTLGRDADWSCSEPVQRGDLLELTIRFRREVEGRACVPVLGRHHAGNVLAAYAALRAAGEDRGGALEGLSQFRGLARRLERLRDWRGVRRYDDYAHHPTAVRAVLATLKVIVGEASGSRLLCLFQPHQISRTERFIEEFGGALSLADEAWVLPVFAAREVAGERTESLSRAIVSHLSGTCSGRFVTSLDHALVTLETALRPGDIFVTLGAGDIDSLHHELPGRFQ